MPDLEARVAELVDNLVRQVTLVAKRAALDALEGALATPSAWGTRRQEARRDTSDIEAIALLARAFINANPGARVDQINAALGTSTREVARPLKKTVRSGQLRTEGARRGTRYYPARA